MIGTARSNAQELERLQRMPTEAVLTVIRAMTSDDVHYFRIYDGSIEVRFGQGLFEMDDRQGRVGRTGQLLGWLAAQLHGTAPAAPQLSAGGGALGAVKVVCAYCGSLYLQLPLTAARQSYGCPNCGAPPKAGTA